MLFLEKAISIAVKAHLGQRDKANKPYILHPLRLMLKMNTEEEMIVAVLHDLVEDCEGWNFERLEKEGFNEQILSALKLLTHDKLEPYDIYIKKIKTNKIALKVKLADLEDNMDLNRIENPDENDFKRIERYKRSYKILTDNYNID